MFENEQILILLILKLMLCFCCRKGINIVFLKNELEESDMSLGGDVS